MVFLNLEKNIGGKKVKYMGEVTIKEAASAGIVFWVWLTYIPAYEADFVLLGFFSHTIFLASSVPA